MQQIQEAKLVTQQILSKKSAKNSYYYPSEREQSCWGKGPFKQRFSQVLEADETSFCSKFCAFLCYRLSHQSVNVPQDEDELEKLLPIRTPLFTISENRITYTWIGHSTAVISIGTQANLMIDPVFSLRCSPFQWIGPKRYRKPACEVSKLPPIHSVLVSHDHYDHLDEQSLNDLEQLYKPIFIAGLDSNDSFPQGSNLIELDWTITKEVTINNHPFQITFVPVCHWAKRKITEKNTRLWGGFIIKTPKGQKIFYSGDTAYCQIFQQIGERFGPFDLAILPIGAYEPNHLMKPHHVNPQEAVIIHKELRSKKSVGVHWGTFPLGFEHWYQPKKDLEKAKVDHNLKEDQFVTIHHGQEFFIDYL